MRSIVLIVEKRHLGATTQGTKDRNPSAIGLTPKARERLTAGASSGRHEIGMERSSPAAASSSSGAPSRGRARFCRGWSASFLRS